MSSLPVIFSDEGQQLDDLLSNDPWLSELPADFGPFFSHDVESNVKIEAEPDFDDISMGSDDSHLNVTNSKQSSKKHKKRKLNPDSMLIAAATESTLKSLQIDPNSAEGKRKKRQIRNRMSAQFHRDRKNGYIKKLEEEISEKCAEIAKLKDTITILMMENASLQTQISNVSYRCPVQDSNVASLNNPGMISPSKVSTDNDDSDSCSLPVHSNSSLLQSSSIGSDEESTATMPTPPRIGSSSVINFLPSSRGMSVVNRSLTIVSAICMVAVCFLNSVQSGDYYSATTTSRRLTEIDSSMYVDVEPQQPILVAAVDIESISVPSARKDENNSTFSSVSPFNTSLFLAPDKIVSEAKPNTKKHLSTSKGRYLRANSNKDTGFNRTLGSSNETDRGDQPIYTSTDARTFPSKNMAVLMRASNSVSKYDNPFGSLFGWPVNAFDFPVLSYSSVVMSEGHVLLDPALALSHNPLSLSSSRQRPDAVSTASMDTYKPLPYKPLPQIPVMSLPLTMYDASTKGKPSVVAVETESKSMTTVPSQELVAFEGKKPWPIVDSESTRDDSGLLAELNLVTIRLPASAVKVGKTWVDSEDSTVESIMNVLNLTDEDSNVQNNNTTNTKSGGRGPYAVSHTSLEINCIILGAKLLHHTTSSPSSSTAV
eukprot:gene26972-35677_t